MQYDTTEELMKIWKDNHYKKGYKNFIEDGIINQKNWKESNLNICFFLKEAYGDYGSLNELFESWGKIKYTLWHNVSYWVYAINHCFTQNDIPDFDDCKKAEAEREEYFNQIAVVNIKKSNGYSESNKDDLAIYLKDDITLLRNQLDLINPNIVICGGTYKEYCKIYDLVPYASESKVTDWIYFVNNTLIFDFIHPAAQIHSAMSYYTIASVFQKSKDKIILCNENKNTLESKVKI